MPHHAAMIDSLPEAFEAVKAVRIAGIVGDAME